MFVRIATFEGVDPSAFEQAAPAARERVTPILQGLSGWKGAAQLLDRRNGTLAIVQVFDTEQNMEAAQSTFDTLPQQLGEMAKVLGEPPRSVNKFEVMGQTGTFLQQG